MASRDSKRHLFSLVVIALIPGTACEGEGTPSAAAQKAAVPSVEEDSPGNSETLEFEDAKFIIEHNSTDQDTGFQVFLDGEPWNRLEIVRPDGRTILDVTTKRELGDLGLTEFFFETEEPPNAEVPIDELLALFPEGGYRFEGRTVDGARITASATLSHTIPAGPVIVSPADGATVDRTNTVVAWNPVTKPITGPSVDIVGYEVIVEKEVEAHPPGFSNPILDVHLPAAATSLTVPKEFLEPGTAYTLEVLALEAGGAQTITSIEFETK